MSKFLPFTIKWLVSFSLATEGFLLQSDRETRVFAKYPMRLSEIKPVKPKTPEQQRVAALQASAKRAQAAVKAERARQQATKAQQSAVAAQQIMALGG